MNKQKRMIYIYEENVEFYDALENKSEFINEKLRLARITTGHDDRKTDPNWHPVASIRETRQRIAEIDARNQKLHDKRKEERTSYGE